MKMSESFLSTIRADKIHPQKSYQGGIYMKTRLISLLLAFSMTLTFLPVGAVSAFAAETGSNELDLTSNAKVTITKTATYDLLPSKNAQGHLVIDAPNCTVTLRIMGNINIAQNQNDFIVVKQGTLVLEGSDHLLGYSDAVSKPHPLITVSSGAKAVINDGQFNSNSSSIVCNNGTVEINGSGRYTTSTSYVIDTRSNSVLTINDGYFHSDSRSVILGNSSQEIEINDGTFINESPRSPTINLNHDKQVYIHGGTIKNLVGGRALDTGDNTTIEEQNGKNILLEGMQGTYVTIAVVSGATFNFKSGTVRSQKSAAIRSALNATVNITGGTICDSLYGVYVKNNPTAVNIGGNVNFENNQNDIFLEENQRITVQENYKGAMSIACENPRENVPVTTSTYGESYQKDLKLTSVNPNYIIGYKQNEDGSEYRYLEKRTGYFVNVVSGTASIDGGVTALPPTTQIHDGLPVNLSAAPAPKDGLEFEQWVVSPASALSDLTSTGFDRTASKTSFLMPTQDITLTAQYRPIPPTIDDAPVDAPVDPGISTAVTIIGGALLVGGLHQLGTELWLIHHLPKGTAIPETRIELAEVLWKDAGQPAPAVEAAYTDIDTDDTDAQQAAQWAIENELMTLRSSEHPDKFDPHVPVSTVKAIRAWKKAQQMKPSAK